MPQMTLSDLSTRMAEIDFVMLATRTDGGQVAARPMSNNGDVEYDGDSWFFSYDSARTIRDIETEPHVTMSVQGAPGLGGLVGKPPLFVSIQGRADLIRDKATFADHWVTDLERWFEQGIDTPGMVLIKVRAERITYWGDDGEGQITV